MAAVGTLPALAVAATGAFHVGLVLTAFGFGFRHGIDWDHIAALTDITSSQDDGRRSMALATMYALGHALVVFALGVGAILLAERLPAGVDSVMERIVGATLLLLGIYVFVALVRQGRQFRMRSRWMLIFAAVNRTVRWARRTARNQVVVFTHDHPHDPAERHPDAHQEAPALVGAPARAVTEHRHGHRHVGPVPDDPFLNYGRATAFGVGMIHGIGAETPTQVLLFLAAAGAGGKAAGLVLLGCFLVGLLSSNTLIALAGTFGFLGASRNWGLYVTVSLVTAVFSLAIGTVFLFGHSTVLPAFFGG
jgi:high-affinity nickel-transport protein